MWELLAVFHMRAWVTYLGIVLALFLASTIVYSTKDPSVSLVVSVTTAAATAGRPQILKGYNTSHFKSTSSNHVLGLTIGILGIIFFAHVRAGELFIFIALIIM